MQIPGGELLNLQSERLTPEDLKGACPCEPCQSTTTRLHPRVPSSFKQKLAEDFSSASFSRSKYF
jgi:hypothetical protein